MAHAWALLLGLLAALLGAEGHEATAQTAPATAPATLPASIAPEDLQPGDCAEETELVAPVHLLQQELFLSKGLALDRARGTDEVADQYLAASSAVGDAVAAAVAEELATTTTTTPPPTGLSTNAVGDLKTFITSGVLYYGATSFCVLGFSVMRRRYPIMYSHNRDLGLTPSKPPDTLWGWFGPTMAVTTDQLAEYITLDHAQLFAFIRIAMQIMLVVGAPMFLVQGPLNWAFGGLAAGQDHLSYLSFGNVEMKSWLYWLHCFEVWGVVLFTTWTIHHAYREFLPRRFKWLREMSNLRANTVLVEGIPETAQSDTEVRKKFQEVLPGSKIATVSMLKDTTVLDGLVASLESARFSLRKAEGERDKDPSCTPMVRESMLGSKVEAIPFWKRTVEELEPQVKEERERIKTQTHLVGAVNLSSAFVTFENRTHAELALRLDGNITFDSDEWNVLMAPEPGDILWADLTQDDTARFARTVIGYLLVVGLYIAYLPCVIGVTNLGKAVDLSKIGLGFAQSAWAGVAPTLGLSIMVAFLPTFLIMIFRSFFTCRAENIQQHKLQTWYFWFQVVFVILATSVGQNFKKFALTVINEPMKIIVVLADTMPYATHYYMNYLVLQAMSHGMVLTRYIPWIKYKLALSAFDEKDAKEVAEPEDQDFYGMGSRSAQWTIMLGIGIVFGTLSPPINVLCWINFAVCRVVYGYLFMFAEKKKADTGGAFFVTQLTQLFPVLVIYVLLMSAVFYRRATSSAPCIISASSLVWVFISLDKFKHYSWEKLPLQDLHDSKAAKKRPDRGHYEQPEMLDDPK